MAKNWLGFNMKPTVVKKDLQQSQQVSNQSQSANALTFNTQAYQYPQVGTITGTAAGTTLTGTPIITTGGAGGSGNYWINPGTTGPIIGPGTLNQTTPSVIIPTPYGANKLADSIALVPGTVQAVKRVVLVAVPNFESVAEDHQFREGDVVLALDTMVCFRRRSNSESTLWEQVRILPDGTVVQILQEVTVQPERKEVFDEFEKHLNPIPEREKNDSSFLQKAKSIFMPKSAPDTPALT